MRFASCCSGSKGNSFVVKEGNTCIVIDCGMTMKYLKECHRKLHVDHIDGLLITHQHSDHTKALKLFDGVEVYTSMPLDARRDATLIDTSIDFVIGDLTILPIPLSHDAENTIGFVIWGKDRKEKLVYITDTGYINTEYMGVLMDADYIVMESNHDVELLMQTTRPYVIKRRILSDSGHLCNEDCAETLKQLVSAKTKVIFLAHISQEGNMRKRALDVNVAALQGIAPQGCVITALGQQEIALGGDEIEAFVHPDFSYTFGLE